MQDQTHRFVSPGRARVTLIAALAAATCLASAANAQVIQWGDLHNGWDVPTLDPATHSFGPTGIETDYQGDVTAAIPPQITNDAYINPFEALHLYTGPGGGVPPNPTTITYDPVADVTRVIESGGALPVPTPDPWPGPNWGIIGGLRTYHSGLNQGFPSPTDPQPIVGGRHWLWDDGHTQQALELAGLDAAWHGKFSKKNKTPALYAAVFVQTQDQVMGTWYLAPYIPVKGKQPSFDVRNFGTKPVSMGLIGVETGLPGPKDPRCATDARCDEYQTMLDNLNEATLLPPGTDGSPFNIVKPPGKPLKSGKIFRFTAP